MMPFDTATTDQAMGAIGLAAGFGSPPDADVSGAPARPQGAPSGDIRETVKQLWINEAGATPQAAEGIARRINAESNFDPLRIGDDGTSFGLYQHHADRAVRLQEWAEKRGANPADPVVQTRFAIHEMKGGDPIAARHAKEVLSATDPGAAYGLFTASFERPAGAPGSEETNLRATAFGGFSGKAQALIDDWTRRIDTADAQYRTAIAGAKDLHSLARAATSKWMQESDKPPANMREAWSSWGSVAMALAAFAPAFGRGRMATALGMAGEMMQAANAADQRTYDTKYKHWKDHLDQGLKAIELLHNEARDITTDAKMSYDEQLGRLDVLAKTYGIAEKLDHAGVQRISDQLELQKRQRDLIVANNGDTETRNSVTDKDQAWLKEHPEFAGKVPPSIHNQHVGEAKRERSGTVMRAQQPKQIEIVANGQVVQRGAAYQGIDGQWNWVGTNEPVSVPAGGTVNLKSTQQPRSAAALAVQKFIEEHPDATADDLVRFQAKQAHDVTVERAFGAGVEARSLTALNTVADHALLLTEYADALNNNDIQRANQLLNSISRETGHSEITNFELARDFFADEVVKVLAASGGGVTDRQEAKERISAAQSPAQLLGAIETAGRFITGRLHAVEQQYAHNDPARRENFEKNLLTSGARAWFNKFESSMPGAAPGGGVIRYDAAGNRIQ